MLGLFLRERAVDAKKRVLLAAGRAGGKEAVGEGSEAGEEGSTVGLPPGGGKPGTVSSA
jgi:hypothetical protein